MTGAPHLYIITDRHAAGGRPLEAVIAAALKGAAAAIKAGARVAVALREKDLTAAPLLALARELRAITADAGAALYVNDRVDVALAAGADGVHLGSASLSPSDVAALAPALAVAVSTHHPDDIVRARRHDNVRFAVFGPVYPTPGKGPAVGIDGESGLRRASGLGLPVLALGGVGPGQVPECRAAGAAGVACIRAIISAADPGLVVTQLMFSHQF